MGFINIINPSLLLAPYVKNYWILNINDTSIVAEQRIIPTGCANLVFHRGNKMFSFTDNELQPQSFIEGQTSAYTDIQGTGNVNMVVVMFQPIGMSNFFRIPTNLFYNNAISIDDLEDNGLKELEKQISEEVDNERCINRIEQFFIKRLHSLKDYNSKRLQAAVNLINTQPQAKITTAADTACLSYKQFNRVFTQHIGINPKEFSRIIRFQRALHILQSQPEISLTQLAFESGYYDQPHLIKEFKSLSGYTPTEYISFCAPYSDYFSHP